MKQQFKTDEPDCDCWLRTELTTEGTVWFTAVNVPRYEFRQIEERLKRERWLNQVMHDALPDRIGVKQKGVADSIWQADRQI